MAHNRNDNRPKPRGSFADLEALLEHLGRPAIIELGKPLPEDQFLPRRRAGKCPASHNVALLGEELHERRLAQRNSMLKTSSNDGDHEGPRGARG